MRAKITGKETKTIQGYYTTIESALNAYIKIKLRKFVSDEVEISIRELTDKIESLKQYIKNITKEM